MNSDDRLFAIIGGTLVTATAAVFLWYGGGITGSIEDRAPVPVPAALATPDSTSSSAEVPVPVPAERSADVIPAADPGPAPGIELAVGTLVSGLSSHPQWAAWLATEGLVARFVAAVEAVADGYSPTEELGFLAAGGPFLVREEDGRLVIAAGTFRRYRLAVEVLSSIDASEAVTILRELEPELEAARRDVAWHRGSFEDRLRQAVDHLLEVEVPPGSLEVERRTLSYAFADDRLELLSGAQRQLLRMGPVNARMVQAKLRELRRAFGWPAALPPDDRAVAALEVEHREPEHPVITAELDPSVRSPEAPVAESVAEPVVGAVAMTGRPKTDDAAAIDVPTAGGSLPETAPAPP